MGSGVRGLKNLKAGKIIQVLAEGNKLRERPCVAITHVEYNTADRLFLNNMIAVPGHFNKLTKQTPDKD